MADYPRLVHWSYYDGRGLFSKKNDKERITRIFITDGKGEEILKGGQVACLNSVGLFGTVQDPYFKLSREEGYTRRAQKHGKMRRDMREKYPELESKLRRFKSKVSEYGEYVYFNVPHTDGFDNPIARDSPKFYNKNFVHKEHFDKDFLKELIAYRPRAMMGGVISGYQKEVLPELFAEIKIKFPNLYKEVLEESEWLQETEKDLTLVDKKAKLVTLSPGNVEVEITFLDKEKFYWDGSKLVNEKKTKSGEVISQTIKPTEDMIVKIINDEVVNENIELVE